MTNLSGVNLNNGSAVGAKREGMDSPSQSLALMPSYEAYKDSGVEWLGDIPETWDIKKIYHLFRIGRGRVISQQELVENGEYPVYSSQTKDDGVLGYIQTYDFDCEQITWTTDGANAGTVFHRSGKHNCTNVCGTLQPFKNSHVNLKYIAYALSDITRFYKRPDTNGAKIMNNEMAHVKVMAPPENEQTRIANFLDKKTAQIDDAIEIKEQQISLLKERKQIIIQQAVTQGLDPNVPMKDSEVEWIGKIPEHWDLVKLGSCLSPVSVKNCPELPLLSITREQGVIERDVDDKESNHNFIPDDLSGYKKLEKGQFGMNKMKAWQGSYGVSKFTGIVSPAYFIFDFTKAINPEFFNWAIRSKLYVSFFGSASDGVRIGQWDLSKARMKVIPFVLPCEEEQLLIAKHLDEKLEQVDVAIKIKRQQIERLREYKSSLINSAVTGKFKITPEMVEQ